MAETNELRQQLGRWLAQHYCESSRACISCEFRAAVQVDAVMPLVAAALEAKAQETAEQVVKIAERLASPYGSELSGRDKAIAQYVADQIRDRLARSVVSKEQQ